VQCIGVARRQLVAPVVADVRKGHNDDDADVAGGGRKFEGKKAR